MKKPRIDVKPSDLIWGIDETDEKIAGRGRWHLTFFLRYRELKKYGREKGADLMLFNVCFLRGASPKGFRDRHCDLDNSIGMLCEKIKGVAGVGIMKEAIEKNESPFQFDYKKPWLKEE